MVTDETLARINQGVQLHHQQGQREAARDLFAQIWDEIGGERGDPLHVCVLAHSMADVQDDVHQEYPSLHLNLGECYRRLGDLGRARECLQRAQEGIGALGDGEYAQLIRGGLERLAQQLTFE